MPYLMNTYNRLPVAFSKGEGVWLWDENGQRYLDAIAGVAVNSLGHSHPLLTQAICAQAETLIHTSNIYRIPRQEELAARLARLSGMDKVFFCSSGAEANEAAIKLARLHGHSKGIDTPTLVVMEQSFHGRTLATLTATGNRKVQAGFEPLVSGFVRVPYDDIDAVMQVAGHNKHVAAILVEPVQGEGGVRVPSADYLQALRTICDQAGWLLMVDEIQTGIGRTGQWFACQHGNVVPDVMTVAKGLGSGIPIGACIARGKAAELFKPGNHGSTFGGNPLACVAALTTLEVIEQTGLHQQAAEQGEFIRDALTARLANIAGVLQIRGIGLMIGIELDRPCGDIVRQALAIGLLVNVTADTVIRLLPPLIISREEAQQLVDRLVDVIQHFLQPNADSTY